MAPARYSKIGSVEMITVALICAEFLITVPAAYIKTPVNLQKCTSSVQFFEAGDDQHAYASFKTMTVQVNSKHWDKISFSRRRELLFHEFGHLFLGLHHRLETYPFNIPRIMRNRVYGVDTVPWNELKRGFLCEIEELYSAKIHGQCYEQYKK
jgi:hypothetical protein